MSLLIDAEVPGGAVASRDGLLVVSGGEVVLANAAMCRMLGTTVSELVGGPPPAWIPPPPRRGGPGRELPLPGGARPVTVTLAAWETASS